MAVVELKTRNNKASEEVVERLEIWLEMAKRGEIISLSLVGLTPDFSTMSTWTQLESIQAMLGGIDILKCRILREVE